MVDARIEQIRRLLPQALLSDWVRLGSRLVRLLRDHHHPEAHEAILSRLLAQAQASVELCAQRRQNVPLVSYPPELPITACKDEILKLLRTHQVVIVAGETGSGKTTQLPKMCLQAGLGIEAKIGCTQPRRVAALSISKRIAEELNVSWGRAVGCKIRFDDHSSPQTYIKVMTDGILLAETQGDPLLAEYNALIIDEAHERSLNIDFLLGYLKGLLAKRPGLKLIITSATINTESFSRAFNDAPIVEVSGRLYPVEVAYAPLDAASEESGDLTYIDAAVRAAEQVLYEPGMGDVLIFMPGERDIRETSDLLETRFGKEVDIVPLFGRLSSGDQQRVFAPTARRKLVVATNIAETSLTIPGIRYVIDSGLARISRYNPRTRTKRLPVEPISQSSANQRKGRCGRVQHGTCIRLYSETDFKERPEYTQPEIQRADLAEVILRMKAFVLGEIETFPFLDPPAPAAIQGGYTRLQELGALDSERALTPLGRDLARLPIDPTLGRMLLQAQHERVTHDLLIIAAGLSIQDPRDRPFEQKEAAAAAHKRFADPRSDFLTLRNIWNAVHEQWETLRTQNQRRKFCKAHFLSYNRMREWQDLYAQLADALEEVGKLRSVEQHLPGSAASHEERAPVSPADRKNHAGEPALDDAAARSPSVSDGKPRAEGDPTYDAIHRAILSGLLSHVGLRTERNLYQGTGSRALTLFPGSALHARAEPPKPPAHRGKSTPKTPAPSQPQWIMAAEIVETSQLFARTVAGIDPLWIVHLAPHLCKTTYHNPHWSTEAGRVLAEAKTTLYGLPVHERKVAYGNIHPKEATEIFIRAALVEEKLLPEPTDATDDPDLERAPSRLGARTPSARISRVKIRVPASLPNSAARNHARGFTTREAPFPQPYDFLNRNRRIRQKIETWQTRMRRHDLVDLDQSLFDFYAPRIQNVSSVYELNRFLREHPTLDFLCATETDLIGEQDLSYDAEAFPDSVALEGQPVPLSYVYEPGEEQDGVTLKLDFGLAQSVSPATVQWAVPGLREAQIGELLRALPKAIRRELMPLAPKVAEIARELRPSSQSLQQDLSKFIHQRYGIAVPTAAWPPDALPAHLRPRIEIVASNQKTLGAGRDLVELRKQLEQVKIPSSTEDPAWERAAQKWERFGLIGWTFGNLPERLTVNENGPLYAWPGLQVEDNTVSVRLFRGQTLARRASLPAVQRLVELALQKDLAWLQKDLRALARFEPSLLGLCSGDDLQAAAFANLKSYLLPAQPLTSLTEANFQAAIIQARQRLPGLASSLMDRLESVLKTRHEILRRFGAAPTPTASSAARTIAELRHLGASAATPSRSAILVANELQNLLPKNFLELIPYERLPQIPRYLKALLIRAERAALNPLKDQERARQLAPYLVSLAQLQASESLSSAAREQLTEFRWMIEEYKVSLFAQELGTAIPVSPKRLDQQLERVNQS